MSTATAAPLFSPPPQLGPVLVHLLRGIVYRDQVPRLWQDLVSVRAQAADYLAVLGLGLELDDAEGYAYLVQQVADGDDAEQPALPRLIVRRPLSYPLSLLLVLLRKRLLEADATGGALKTVITRTEVVALLRTFLPERSNEARLVDQIDTLLNKAAEVGFVRALPEAGHFEIRRILKAFVDAQWLADFETRLAGYRDYAEAADDE